MVKIKEWFIKYGDYFIPALITLAILFISFLIKGVYPFGDEYIALIDYDQGLIPSYTHLWDFMHRNSSFIFNETLGMGSNIYASSVLNTFFSPLAYLVGLSSRENVCYFVGFIVVIKMMLMATTSYIVLKKWFKKVDNKTICVFSLLWTFSSWLLVHISNVGWLDVMIIFPFLIESIKLIIEKGKISYFVSMLTLCLIFSYYMSYMILIMLILGVICLNFTIIKDRMDKRRIVGQMFVGILLSLFISMFAFLPSFLQTQASYRFSDEVSGSAGFSFYAKLAMILFYGILLYVPFKLFKKHYKDDNTKFFMAFIGLTLLPVILEPINKMWHTGSYFSYPFRFAFIPIFFLILACLYYFNNYYENDLEEEVKKNGRVECFCLALFLALVFNVLNIVLDIYCNLGHLAFLIDLSTFFMYVIPSVTVLIAIVLAMKIFKKEHRKNALLIISMAQIILYSVGYMGVDNDYDINAVYEVKDEFNIDELDKNYAIKDETRLLIANFPLIMDHKSISTWLHINGEYANLNAQALGYGTKSTMIFSYGGTAFSDMLASTKYVLSYKELDESLYTLLKESSMNIQGEETPVYLYEYKYMLPLGLVVDSDLELMDLDAQENPFYNQNKIYKELFDKDNDLISVDTYSRITSKEIIVSNSEDTLNYLYVGDSDYENIKVSINGEELDYLTGTGIVNLGVYDGDIKVKVESEEILNEVDIASIKVSDLEKLSEENTNDVKVSYNGDKVNINVTSNKAGKLYIPITFENDSWSATNNGNVTVVDRFLETYLSVDVEEGENNIVLTFAPQKADLGLKLTIITLIIAIVFLLINIKFKFFTKKGFINVMYYIGAILGILIISYIYIIPLMK